MGENGRGPSAGERGLAVALLGFVLFNRPLLDVFDRGIEAVVGGWPALYLYMFGSWACVVLLLFVMTRRRG
ncbi:MAG: hypothetical protein EA356_04795 [Geminicoccaceae bacterium]|nr:MAG: hypothetical protein EA356_04795 [Geminicoccaceae bacterium]